MAPKKGKHIIPIISGMGSVNWSHSYRGNIAINKRWQPLLQNGTIYKILNDQSIKQLSGINHGTQLQEDLWPRDSWQQIWNQPVAAQRSVENSNLLRKECRSLAHRNSMMWYLSPAKLPFESSLLCFERTKISYSDVCLHKQTQNKTKQTTTKKV